MRARARARRVCVRRRDDLRADTRESNDILTFKVNSHSTGEFIHALARASDFINNIFYVFFRGNIFSPLNIVISAAPRSTNIFTHGARADLPDILSLIEKDARPRPNKSIVGKTNPPPNCIQCWRSGF